MVDNSICQGYNTNTLEPVNGSERKKYLNGCIREGIPWLEVFLTEIQGRTSLSRSAEGK